MEKSIHRHDNLYMETVALRWYIEATHMKFQLLFRNPDGPTVVLPYKQTGAVQLQEARGRGSQAEAVAEAQRVGNDFA